MTIYTEQENLTIKEYDENITQIHISHITCPVCGGGGLIVFSSFTSICQHCNGLGKIGPARRSKK